jgi:hypothetical protein
MFGLRSLVTLTIATLALVSLGAPAATALTAKPNTSFVGTYALHATIETQPVTGTIQINSDGTAVDQNGFVGTWTSSAKEITITYTDHALTEVFAGKQSKKGIGTKKRPGTVAINGGAAGVWYAVKTG